MTTSNAGNTRSESRLPSMVRPASMLTIPASTSTGTDSRTMRRSIGRCVRQPTTMQRMLTSAQTAARTGVTPWMPATPVARKRLGR